MAKLWQVSTHSRLKAAGRNRIDGDAFLKVSTHSRLKAAGRNRIDGDAFLKVSTHSRLKAAGSCFYVLKGNHDVSTHSRLKAAGLLSCPYQRASAGFNTQPPEGGWLFSTRRTLYEQGFNTQPPEGGWRGGAPFNVNCNVSTHSRLKAAGPALVASTKNYPSFNTQPPEGGWNGTSLY